MHSNVRSSDQKRAEAYAKRAGYARGGAVSDDAADKKMVTAGVHQHESNMHKGKPKTKLALKSGGRVEGSASIPRLDGKGRRGGNVNVIIQGTNPAEKQEAAKAGLQKGVQVGAQLAMQQVAAKMGGAGGPAPGAGAPPPGAPGPAGAMPPPGAGPMATGGRMIGGGDSGVGRLERSRAASGHAYGGRTRIVREHLRRYGGGV